MFLTLYQNEKVLDWPKLIELTDDTINVTEKVKFCLGLAENIVEQEDHDGPISLT